jgi:hypothetical protein
MTETTPRTKAIQSLAICDPAQAEARAIAYGATPEEITYLRQCIRHLGGKILPVCGSKNAV